MTARMRLLFLGTGGSLGIPVIGCQCDVCHSSNPHNLRSRPGALLTIGDKKLLIDASPDFRSQAIKHQISMIDAVLFTHAHHDHSAGIDDLRVYYMIREQPLPCLMSEATAEDLMKRYDYIFTTKKHKDKLTTRMEVDILTGERGKTVFQGIEIQYFTYEQMGMAVNGFRFGNLSYVTDIRHYPDTIFEDLSGTKTLILSALRLSPSPLHFSVDEAVSFAEKVGAEKTWLIHIAHELDHEKTNAYLPPHVRLAYDGLEIEVDHE